MKNIPDNSIDMILTDVPYDVSKKNNFKSIKNYTKKTE
jgi:DNA modification methylase